ncbi:MAG: A/G-specific adenine glycosylase [Verrucomicrobiota bacterium]
MKGEVGAFGKRLVEWFAREGRDYPWRQTEDAYAILVSEVMLQQTQIATVLGPKRYYERWMEAFPTVEDLAGADEASVLKQWEGLGYYSRARNLWRAAQVVVAEHGGEFPRATAAIEKLPGVGRYTAGAVASFAYDACEPIVDGNVARVFARLFDYREAVDGPAGRKQMWVWAEALLPESGGAQVYNSALMELGQRICTVKGPRCGECPVSRSCLGKDGEPEALPVKVARRKSVKVDENVVWAVREADRGHREVLLVREESGRRRKGLWRLPEREVEGMEGLLEMKYSITHHRVTLRVYRMDGLGAGRLREGEAWVAWAEMESLPMAAPYRKAVERIIRMEETELALGGS